MMTSQRFRSRVQEFELLLLPLLPLLLLLPPPSSSCCYYVCYCYCYNCSNYYTPPFLKSKAPRKPEAPNLPCYPVLVMPDDWERPSMQLGMTYDAGSPPLVWDTSTSCPYSRLVGYIIGRISLHCALWTGTHYLGNSVPR